MTIQGNSTATQMLQKSQSLNAAQQSKIKNETQLNATKANTNENALSVNTKTNKTNANETVNKTDTKMQTAEVRKTDERNNQVKKEEMKMAKPEKGTFIDMYV